MHRAVPAFSSRRCRQMMTLLVALLCCLSPSSNAVAPMDAKEKGKPNRLAKESSPYLLQHAYNPVDWHPWGAEAFEKAKKEKKLVFLSIGYSSCHWCHVMEKESFSHQDVAAILNKNFICIKVDREERPDIDDIYMTALHTMGARGGWPLSMFLTPEGKPVVGGTYWPRDDREIDGQTVNGFKTILTKVHEVWQEKPKDIETQAEHYATETNSSLGRAVRANPLVALDRALAQGAAQQLTEEIDPVHGGIGRKASKWQGTKFPMASSVIVLLDHAHREKDADLKKLVKLTLDKMAMGGIYDQVGGGFHRYSTERTWTVPHFEKMLYDNAQLVELYADAYRLTPDPVYERVIRETLAFIKREMTSPDGGFYSALDADSNGEEGEFYVWSPGELEKVLGKEDGALINAVYGVAAVPNFEMKFHILRLPKPLDDAAKDQKLSVDELNKKLTALKIKLLDYRAKRERPFLDTKILTAWNGQMIAAYSKAGQVLKDDDYVKTAARAAEFVLKNLRNKEGRLLRTYSTTGEGKAEAKLNAYLDDYAFVIHGLLNLHDATADKRWLDEAKTLNEQIVKWFSDPEAGGFYFTSSDHEKLFARPKDYADNAQPSANGIALRNFVRLWKKTKDDQYQKLAEKSLRQYAGMLRGFPTGVPSMCLALHEYLDIKGAEAPELKKGPATTTGNETTDDVVKLAATLDKGQLTVTINIAEPWHIYANPVDNDKFERAATTVTVRAGGKIVPAEFKYPEGTKVENKDVGSYRVYEKQLVLKATLAEAVDGPLEISVKVQACTDGEGGRCLALTTLKTIAK